MKYRTVIELICEASSREEASNIAGEYLKGELDFGVSMKCRSQRLTNHKVIKYGIACALCLVIFSSMMFKVTMLGSDEKVKSSIGRNIYNTYTIMPALKTKHRAEFKKEWDEQKEKAVLEYLKK